MYTEALRERKTLKGKSNVSYPSFNFSSPTQLGKLLYESLELPPQYTPKGNWCTNGDALEAIEHLHPIPKILTNLSRYNTYYSTFIKGIAERAINGRIYPTFNVNGTRTGRISHENPNMGNMPSRDPYWNKIRGIFIPDDGECVAKADYRQLEIVVAAHYSQDKNLLRIVNEGISQHDVTAEGLKIPRDLAKTLNFAMQYLCGVKKIALLLRCSMKEAQYIYDKYWETYAGQKKLIDICINKVQNGEYIESIFGRRRHFVKQKRPSWDKSLKQGYNALIQGTGGDLTNMAFYNTNLKLKEMKIGRTSHSIHDEIVCFPRTQFAKETEAVLCEEMVKVGVAMGLTVPLSVESETGLERWKK